MRPASALCLLLLAVGCVGCDQQVWRQEWRAAREACGGDPIRIATNHSLDPDRMEIVCFPYDTRIYVKRRDPETGSKRWRPAREGE